MAPSKKLTKKPVKAKPAKSKEKVASPSSTFPIVGIGASAGGLEPLEIFLANVPPDSGMAFVIVQHLDPTRKGVMVELLQRATKMSVMQITDRMRVEPNCVYIIPPNHNLSILHGVLQLMDPIAARGLRLPIDFFFRTLADDQHENCIGVILSGMGSDGTLGLRAIKEKAGTVYAQEPATAKFDSMPRSAIESGVVDVIASPEELPDKIIAFISQIPRIANSGLKNETATRNALDKVFILLRGQTGHDFSLYKHPTISRRIERRMGLHQITEITSYVRFLQENPQEVELLFRELLIGVTSFFRDPKVWEQVRNVAFPTIMNDPNSNRALRAWIPACSTGEEAYTLAILFKEALEEFGQYSNITLQIFATDLDLHSIEKAREGIFLENIASEVSAERLDRFFVKVSRGYQIKKSIREMVIFAQQNIIMDPPFTKLDIISCRNLLIYLKPELQAKIVRLFHYSLNAGGFLLLGGSETIGDFANLFDSEAGKNRLYRRGASVLTSELADLPMDLIPIPGNSTVVTPKKMSNLQTLADQLLLQKYSPAAVLTNNKGDILYISGRTGKYLEPAAGKANWNIFVMARDGLNHRLGAAFQKAVRKTKTVQLKDVLIDANNDKRFVDIIIEPQLNSSALQGMVMIVFTDVAAEPAAKLASGPANSVTRNTEIEQELEHARLEVESIREEMQSTHEELKSADEEMQSAMEELQSTNEELTTSKEELQSMNEEMHTVNQELQMRVDELSRASSDMKNLLDSTDIATLFLDNTLRLRRFTSETGKLTQLIPGDIGRPISDIASNLLYPTLSADSSQVLRSMVKFEKQITIPDGSWFLVRILPYCTLDNKIDGVVITFTNITESKSLEAELRAVNDD